MKHNVKKTFFWIFVIALIIICVSYATYAFFQSTATNDNIEGTSQNNDFNVNANVVYQASNLIPVSSEIVNLGVNKAENKCRDDNNRDVCSLYEISVTNTGDELSLLGFVRTNSSTYITENLKYRVYTKNNDTYTAVTDILTVSNESGNSVYFKKDNANYNIPLPQNTTVTYYISFWIEEIEGEQNDDQAKDYSCRFGFEGINGSQLSASFSV